MLRTILLGNLWPGHEKPVSQIAHMKQVEMNALPSVNIQIPRSLQVAAMRRRKPAPLLLMGPQKITRKPSALGMWANVQL